MMRSFLLSQLQGQSGTGVIDLCVDHKLIADLHPESFGKIAGLELFPDLEKFSATMHALRSMEGVEAAPLLKELDLSFNEISDISAVHFLPFLQVLTLSHNEITSLEGIDFPDALRELDLGFNQLSDISALGKLEKLEILGLNGNRRLANLAGLPNGLRELHVNQCFIQDYGGLRGKNRLEVLTISPGSMNGLESLTDLSALRTLHINAGRIHSMLRLPPMPALTSLRIYKAMQVAEIQGLEGLPQLQHLDISNSLLEGPPHLGGCRALNVLEIKFSPLENLDGIAELPSLERLVLTGSRVSAQALAQLRAQRPDLEIEY